MKNVIVDSFKEESRAMEARATKVIARFQSGIDAIGNDIDDEMKKERVERIKRRIRRHQYAVNELNLKLQELQG